jgi:hypothetical protein
VEGENKEPVVYFGVLVRHLGPLHSSGMRPEQSEGYTLANVLAKVLPLLDIQEQRHNLKTYKKCFVGSETVTAVVNSQMAKRDGAPWHNINSINLCLHSLQGLVVTKRRFRCFISCSIYSGSSGLFGVVTRG